MRILRIGIRQSNREVLAFIIFNHFATTVGRNFSRSQLMTSTNLEYFARNLCRFRHKKDMEQAEASLQKAIQGLRDDGYLLFHGHGDYTLTEEGVMEGKRIMAELDASNMLQAESSLKSIAESKKEEESQKTLEMLKALTSEELARVLAIANSD